MACVVIATVLSATDPVAVISLFKKLGTDKKISILIEGESILNDGSAVVILEILITLLLSLVESDHKQYSTSELIWTAIDLSLTGFLIG